MGQDFQIADWRVEPRLNTVSRNGTTVRLEPKVMAVLVCLAQHAGEPVSKEELLQSVWPDTFVTQDVLKRSVFELRRVLEDDARQPRIIQTIPKSGYRLVMPVSTLDVTGDLAVPVRDEASRSSRQWRSLALVPGVAALLLVVAVVGYRSLGRFGKKSGRAQIRSVAVLPLENLSRDPAQDYLSDGLTDALITDLAQVGSLKVISRTSSMLYKGTRKSVPEIAKELSVDGIIEGTVQRSGDRVRITAQLIDGSSDRHLWADSYETDFRDTFALERDVTGDIARQVQGRITSSSQSTILQPQTTNPRALEAYLRGIYHENAFGRGSGEQELRKAAENFQQAIDSDPNFVRAWIGLGRARSELPVRSPEDRAITKKAAETALALDPKSPEALWYMANTRWNNLDWSGAEQEFRQSIAVNPNNAPVRKDFCIFFAEMGRLDEALHECQIAQELEPDKDHLPEALYWQGEYGRSIAMLRMMAAQHPEDGDLHYQLFDDLALNKSYKDSIAELEKALTQYGFAESAARIHRAFAASGYEAALREFAKEFERLHAAKQMFMPVNLADVYATLGDKDRAFYWLEQAYAHRDSIGTGEPLDYFLLDPMLNPLHSDLRYKDLVHRMRLPQ